MTEIECLRVDLQNALLIALATEREYLKQIQRLERRIAAAEIREDEVRQENEALQNDIISLEAASKIDLTQAIDARDQAIQDRDHWQTLNARHVRELDAVHEWLADSIYPHLEAGRKVFDRLQECRDAWNTAGVPYPWD